MIYQIKKLINIIRKVKHVILHSIMQFINEKIRTIFAYEDKKILKEKKYLN